MARRDSREYGGGMNAARPWVLGTAHSAYETALAELESSDAGRRLAARDASLFSNDTTHAAAIANRLGWVDCPEKMRDGVADLRAFAARARHDGFRRTLLLGMGGSSLCPEVFATTFGAAADGLELRVLDSTDPDAVREAGAWATPHETLFLVASKSGTTLEVASFEAFFWEREQRDGARFVAVTDPGTALARTATERSYRRVFENPPDIGGRYSALSYFGLVPAALLGMPVGELVDGARAMAAECAASDAASPGARLGAFVGGLARAGRDKLTLLATPSVASFGSWIEQLVAESTGKIGRGVVPVDLEPLRQAAAYGEDRAFVLLLGEGDARLEALARELGERGHPVAHLDAGTPAAFGAAMYQWEVATAFASVLLGVNPFDEPNVTEAKNETATLLGSFEKTGRLGDFPGATPDDAGPALERLLCKVGPADYVVLSAFFRRTDERAGSLSRLRHALGARVGAATTLGWGPRFLHSTGQLHKGGPATGVFIVLTADADADLEIPGRTHGFGVLRAAQALGDLEVLERRGRRALRIHLGTDVDGGLAELERALG